MSQSSLTNVMRMIVSFLERSDVITMIMTRPEETDANQNDQLKDKMLDPINLIIYGPHSK